jgi:hypothetical protein
LSNLSAHRPADYRLESFLPKNLRWEEEALFSDGSKGRQFGETDWTDVPKIDYASGEFTQLSIPEPAEVVDDASEFVLDDLDSLRQMGKRSSQGSALNSNSEQAGEDHSKSKQHRHARALTLELVKTTYKVKDLSQSERLAREKLKNPEAHSNADQPFIPTYGESRRALLKKLGFSDDYELSLSGRAQAKNETNVKNNSKDDPKSELGAEGRGSKEDSLNSGESGELSAAGLDPQNADFKNLDAQGSEDLKDSSDKGENALESLSERASSTDTDSSAQSMDSLEGSEANGFEDQSGDSSDAADVSAEAAKLATDKAFEEGYQKGLLEAKEKAAVQESLQTEIALKEEESRALAQKEKEAQVQLQRESERKEYEREIQNLKDKIKSFDESLLGELEKKKEQLDKDMKPKVKVLTDLCDQLKELTEDSQTFFEPLKRLSVHIAEQLVLGELSASPKVVERLIKRCIDDLDMRDTPVVKVELNPLDKALLESAAGANLERLKISAAQNMQVGSVRVSVNDTQIEDLIQNRLETIANRLLGQPQEWKERSTLMNKKVDQKYFDENNHKDELDADSEEALDAQWTESTQVESLEEGSTSTGESGQDAALDANEVALEAESETKATESLSAFEEPSATTPMPKDLEQIHGLEEGKDSLNVNDSDKEGKDA